MSQDASAEPSATAGMLEPKQSRSRESQTRVLNATLALLIERGDDSFTIADVSEYARASVGSIYGRFENKAALLRAVHDREMTRIDGEMGTALSEAADAGATFARAVRAVIAARVSKLAEEGPAMRALINAAAGDPAVSARGRESAMLAQRRFADALREVCERFDVTPSVGTIEWCDEVVFSLTARHLGIGVRGANLPVRSLAPARLIELLTRTVVALLEGAGDHESIGLK